MAPSLPSVADSEEQVTDAEGEGSGASQPETEEQRLEAIPAEPIAEEVEEEPVRPPVGF